MPSKPLDICASAAAISALVSLERLGSQKNQLGLKDAQPTTELKGFWEQFVMHIDHEALHDYSTSSYLPCIFVLHAEIATSCCRSRQRRSFPLETLDVTMPQAGVVT